MKDEKWCADSKGYMQEFRERVDFSAKNQFVMLWKSVHEFEKKLSKGNDVVDVIAGIASSSSILNNQLSLRFADAYLKEAWLEYALNRQLVELVSQSIIDLLRVVDEMDGGDWGYASMQSGLVGDFSVPIAISSCNKDAIELYSRILDQADGASELFSFLPELKPELGVMLGWALGDDSVQLFEKFEPNSMRDYLGWRYARCMSRKHGVSFALALVPEELIAYYKFFNSVVPSDLRANVHFEKMQCALDVIDSGEYAALADEEVILALRSLSGLAREALARVGKPYLTSFDRFFIWGSSD